MPKLTLTFKGKVLRVAPLHQGKITIGSDPDCELFIDSMAVNRRHAIITMIGGDTVIRDLGTAEGTFVNGEQIEEHILQDNDHIRIGKHELTFVEDDIDTEAVPVYADEMSNEGPVLGAKAKKAWLQLLSGNSLGKTIHIRRNITNLGTPGVQTAAIVHRSEGFFLSHLEGKQSPQVNEESIGDKTWPLKDGDIIQIGNVKMLFSLQ